jgi:hypothetical protein
MISGRVQGRARAGRPLEHGPLERRNLRAGGRDGRATSREGRLGQVHESTFPPASGRSHLSQAQICYALLAGQGLSRR